jgi:hypothetical protein
MVFAAGLSRQTLDEEERKPADEGRLTCYLCHKAGHMMRDCPDADEKRRAASRGVVLRDKNMEVRCRHHASVPFHPLTHRLRTLPRAQRQMELERHAQRQEELERKCAVLTNPLLIAGRTYTLLGFKGKALWFVATSGPPPSVDTAWHGFPKDARAAWARLARFPLCKTVPKMCSRIELAFSGTIEAFQKCRFYVWRELQGCGGTWAALQSMLAAAALNDAVSADENAIHVFEIDDIHGREGDSTVARDPTGEPFMMTDGNGLISVDLALEVAEACLRGASAWSPRLRVPPLLSQMRLW